ncbi:MAG: hypothetical protein HZC03_00925 [Candidatus Lloydbacteria bacterium]|nr:hypothetical protein [Candidatus Lloydbacteria bacterium]
MAKKFLIIPLSFLAFFSCAFSADAAVISLLPQARTFGVGQEFSVDIKIDTEETYINAGQATVRFPMGMLELVSVDKAGSAFGFWVEEPKISNEDGTLMFTGGTTNGVSGGSLQILKMKFKAKDAGLVDIVLQDAAVTASDGKGTNVLSALKGTSVSIGTPMVPPVAPLVSVPVSTKQIVSVVPSALPQKIVREPITAKKAPMKPELQVPLYDDQTRWHNHQGEVVVFWDVPPDAVEVAVAVDHSPRTIPQKPEAELFTGKNLGVLKEGVSYVHVRFRNNVGWGETAHFKIAIDITPPLPFEISDSLTSDNPTPKIQYEAHDALSGVSHTVLFFDGKEFLRSTSTSVVLPPQLPGPHAILARVFDFAENSAESEMKFEILPLQTPVVDFISASITVGEQLFASGTAIPNAFIDVRVLGASQREVLADTAASDARGNWKISITKPLPAGMYTVSIVARDERGARSFPVEGVTPLKVHPKTVLSFGGFIDLGWLEILIILVLLITSGAGFFASRYVSKNKTREAYKTIVGRDVNKFVDMLLAFLKEFEAASILNDESRRAKQNALIEQTKETVAKMKKYIGEEVNKLGN